MEGTASVRYTPAANYLGSDVFSYTVSDGTQSATAQVLVTVASIDDEPRRVEWPMWPRHSRTIDFHPVLSNDSDVDGDTLTGDRSDPAAARHSHHHRWNGGPVHARRRLPAERDLLLHGG